MPLEYLTGKNILVVSPEPHDHIPVSKHHYSHALAKAGNNVFFLNPPSTQEKVSTHAIPGLHIVDYKTVRGLNRMPSFLRDYFNVQLIRKIERLCNVQFDIIWTFDPFRFQNLDLFKSAKIRLYHAVDIHQAPLEKKLVETSDVILAVSDRILRLYENSGKVTAKISHGLADHFLEKTPQPLNTGSIRVGYIGNLDNWCIDKETLLKIVSENPAVEFYFIGPYAKDSQLGNQLASKSNCILVGKVPTIKLPDLLFQYNLFLMCYDGDNVAVNSNHHKILEYLATGKPSVINYTDDYRNRDDLVVMSDKNSELPGLFRKVVSNLSAYDNPALAEKRIAFAKENSYTNHLRRIDKILVNFRHAVAASHS
jgi:glycosyltransferase involved in cell wall biosynthesis